MTTLVDLLCGIFTDPMWAWQWSLKRYLCGQCTAGHVAMFHVPYRGRSTITCWISFGCKCGFPVVTWLAMCVCVCLCAGAMSELHPSNCTTIAQSPVGLWNERIPSFLSHVPIHAGTVMLADVCVVSPECRWIFVDKLPGCQAPSLKSSF